MRVGPGHRVTHRRPGRYIATMAPALGLRGGRESRAEPGEIRKAGNEGAAPRAGAQAEREALKGGRPAQGRDPAGPAGPSLRPRLRAGPPSRGPPAASLAPKPCLPLEDWFLSSAPEAPPHRSASPPAHDEILRTLAPGKKRLATAAGWQTNQELGPRPEVEPTESWRFRSRGWALPFPFLPGLGHSESRLFCCQDS